MSLRIIPAITLFLLAVADACWCPPKGVAEIERLFHNKNVTTIALAGNAVPSRPYPDYTYPNEPIDWTMLLVYIVKGDCGLRGKIFKAQSGAQASVCGANPVNGHYWIAFDKKGRFNTCLFERSWRSMTREESRAIFRENQCLVSGQVNRVSV